MNISTIEATKNETAKETSIESKQPVEKDHRKSKGNKNGNDIDICNTKMNCAKMTLLLFHNSIYFN